MTMEENKKTKEKTKEDINRKLTYDELNKAFADLHQQYQRLASEYRKAMDALGSRDFEYTSFFLQALFRVLDHPDRYGDKFVDWCVKNIEAALTGFAESAKPQNAAEKKDETE